MEFEFRDEKGDLIPMNVRSGPTSGFVVGKDNIVRHFVVAPDGTRTEWEEPLEGSAVEACFAPWVWETLEDLE